MSKKRPNNWAIAHARRGQSEAVTVRPGNAIELSSSELAIPRDVYDADYAWAVVRNGAVSLFFAKAISGESSDLLSRVEVRFPPEDFLRHFWSASREFHESTKNLISKTRWNISPREHPRPEKLRAQKQHSVWANINNLSRHGSAACLDFFHLAPDAIVRYTRTNDVRKLDVQPVLRVLTTLQEAVSLLDECERIAGDVEPVVLAAEELVGPAKEPNA